MPAVSLSTRLEYKKIAPGTKQIHMLIKLMAQKHVQKDRKPISIAAVIDCSTSMAGEKIDYAKKTLKTLIKHLGPEDTLSVSAFSDTIKPIFKIGKMDAENKAMATKEVDQLHVIANTNLSGAVLEGWDRIKGVDNPIARVMLFTDGQPTAGILSVDTLIKMSEKPKGLASMTMMGYGTDVNKELLASMASVGGGNYYFVDSPEACLSIFGSELGGLLSCVGQNINLEVNAPKGVRIVGVLSDFHNTTMPNLSVIKVGDCYADEVRKILLKLEVDDVHGSVYGLSTKSTFYDIMAGENRYEESLSQIWVVSGSEADGSQDIEVREQMAIQAAADAQEKARQMADRGDFEGAQACISMCAVTLDSIGTETAAAFSADLKENVMSSLQNMTSYMAAGGSHYAHSNIKGYSKGRSSNKSLGKVIGTSLQGDTVSSFEKEDDKKS